MKNLSILLCGLLASCVSNPVNFQREIQLPNPDVVRKVEYYVGKNEYNASISIHLVAIIPKEPIVDEYLDNGYLVRRAR